MTQQQNLSGNSTIKKQQQQQHSKLAAGGTTGDLHVDGSFNKNIEMAAWGDLSNLGASIGNLSSGRE